jgi:hypothetical protein
MASEILGASAYPDPMSAVEGAPAVEAVGVSVSAVSWAAIVAGAVAAAALTALLISLGAGLGLGHAPLRHEGSEAAAFTVWTGIWLIVTQWLAAALGGYLTGRLRTRWRGTHEHEVHFRDTAHGFLAWALATLLVAAMIVTAAGVTTGAAGAAARGTGPRAADPYAYDEDLLFRGPTPEDDATADAAHAKAGRLLTHIATRKLIPAEDRAYLADMVAQRTGLAPADALRQTDLVIADARHRADEARKGVMATGIFNALAMLIGAFIASVAAVLGGRQRDLHA